MVPTIDRLLSLKVGDVMSQAVVHVESHQTMDSAAGVLMKHQISGMPVVDEQQRCVGVISATDFVRRSYGDRSAGESKTLAKHALQHGGDDAFEIVETAGDLVSDHMAPAVQSVRSDEPLLTAVHMMCAQHIHRVPVLDARGHLAGILTSLDVVAAVANVIEESQ